MKKTCGIGGLVLLAATAAGQTAGWFVQDFEGVAVGPYAELSYAADGVEVTLSGDVNVIEHGLGGMLGARSVTTGKSKRATLLIEFSETVHGVTIDILSECGLEERIAAVTCFDAEGHALFTLGGRRTRPCNHFSRWGASILAAPLVASCAASNGMFDNLVVQPSR